MSDPATVVPLVQETPRSRSSDGERVVVPISDGIVSPARASSAEEAANNAPSPETTTPDTAEAEPAQSVLVLEPRRQRRWFSAFCALLALLGAAAALAAPWLRPQVAAEADLWLGKGNAVSDVLVPSPLLDPGWQMARAEALRAIDARLGDFSARLDHMAAAQQTTAADVARAVAELRADHGASAAVLRSVDDLTRQTKELRSATLAIDTRVRATGLLTLALRVRRDVDAGLPITQDLAALRASGPFPAPVDRALQKLQEVGQGTPTMRDLADEFDRVIDRMAARAETGQSWASRSWANMTALFGKAPSDEHGRFIERLRALALDGRFSEAANEVEASDDADVGAQWAARVRSRANAVLATQALMTYSLAAYENAFTSVEAEGKLTQ